MKGLFLLTIISHLLLHCEAIGPVGGARQQILQRLYLLRLFAMQNAPPAKCDAKSSRNILVVMRGPYGNSSNNLIEFTHALWVANKTNRMLLLPPWMLKSLKPFRRTLLHKLFCFSESSSARVINVMQLGSGESFFLFDWLKETKTFDYSPELIRELSLHFLVVYAALWSEPVDDILEESINLIEARLKNNLRYVAAHKRSMEGFCASAYEEYNDVTDFDPTDLPMGHPSWQQVDRHNHPICEMRAEFVLAVARMHDISGNVSVFLAHDGQADVSDYVAMGAVFSSGTASQNYSDISEKSKYIDRFVSMHSQLFVMNPRSTFSWEIYLIRVILGLESTPIIRNNDFYMQRVSNGSLTKNGRDGLWVNFLSVIEAARGGEDTTTS